MVCFVLSLSLIILFGRRRKLPAWDGAFSCVQEHCITSNHWCEHVECLQFNEFSHCILLLDIKIIVRGCDIFFSLFVCVCLVAEHGWNDHGTDEAHEVWMLAYISVFGCVCVCLRMDGVNPIAVDVKLKLFTILGWLVVMMKNCTIIHTTRPVQKRGMGAFAH